MIIEQYLNRLEVLLQRKKVQSPIFRGQLDSFNSEGKLKPVISTAARRLNYSLAKEKGKDDILTQSRFIEYHNDLIDKARKNGYNLGNGNSHELYDLEILAQIQHYGGGNLFGRFY